MPTPSPVVVRLADLASARDAASVLSLLDAYARDPFGDSKPLDAGVRERLVPALREHPTTLVFLAEDDASDGSPAASHAIGIATCFVGFSTFKARPLVNVHDLAVLPEARGRGVGRALLAAIESHARELDCCRLTLEVLENNPRARALYESIGMGQPTYGDGTGGAVLFYSKTLD